MHSSFQQASTTATPRDNLEFSTTHDATNPTTTPPRKRNSEDLPIERTKYQLHNPQPPPTMRLTADLIGHSLSYLNPLKEREMDLRGASGPIRADTTR